MDLTYKQFIDNILQTRGRFNCGEKYHERHHILPKCIGGTDDEENLIDLFAREHYIAHKLLALENPHNEKLNCAFWCMSHLSDKNQERYVVTPEEYEQARIIFSSLRKNSKVSEETRRKMSKAHSGENNSFFGKKHSDEARKKIKEARAKQIMVKGKKRSKESKERMSKAQKGRQTNENHPRAKKVFCDGIVFGCIKFCANYYNININTLSAWLRGINPMPEEFKKKGLKYYQES